MEYPLTPDQQRGFDLVENTNDNIFIGGKPGVGKSVLIRALTEYGQKHYTLAAPTGLAAINVNGKTLHSLFGIPVSDGILTPDFNKYTTNTNIIKHVLYTVKHLIIDEISMVRSDIFDFIERQLREIKGNDLPFGGVQIIVVGDFFQLPPIVDKDDKDAMRSAGWRSEFAFDSFCFQSFKPFILTEVLRQADEKFISILHSARTGEIADMQLMALNKYVKKCSDFRIRLAGKNREADEINIKHLNALPEPSVEYSANSFGNWPAFPAETILKLKVGAQVMVKKNSADRPPNHKGKFDSQVVNGTIGIVEEMLAKDDTTPDRIKIRLKNGNTAFIYIARWERKEKEKVGDQWCEKLLASFEQIPLQLAWAISMHKSQGQTFDSLHINAHSIFAAGQLYVALSRVRSLDGLSLEYPLSAKKFWANSRVVEFMKSIEEPIVKKKIKKAA